MADINHPPTDLTPDGSPAEWVDEHLLIEQLGIPLKKIRALRPAGVRVLLDGICWPLADATALALSVGAALALVEKKSAPADALEEMVVKRWNLPNKRVIECRRDNGELVFVSVCNSANYRPFLRIGGEPMMVKARPSTSGNWWVLVGREPIAPGQW